MSRRTTDTIRRVGLTGLCLVVMLCSSSARAQTNLPGSLDVSFDAGNGRHGANGSVRAVALQPDGKAIIGGQFTEVGVVARRGFARINTDGTVDTTFASGIGIDDFIYTGGYYETTESFLATATVGAIALQPDGKIILGGLFKSVGGTRHTNIVRLEPSGTVDGTFNAAVEGVVRPRIRALAVQADGRIVAGGEFTLANGLAHQSLARFNDDGTLDTAFAPQLPTNSIVDAILIETNGNILIGGEFQSVNGVSLRNLARLLSDGSIDPSFTPGAGPDGRVRALAATTDGKMFVGGSFTNYAGHTQKGIVRIETNGVFDASFEPIPGTTYASGWTEVDALAAIPDGAVLVGGFFGYSGYGVSSIEALARFEANGSMNTNGPFGAFGRVNALALQTDGKAIVGGEIQSVGRISRSGFGRIHTNGVGDVSYTPGTGLDNAVFALVPEPDGKILVGGSFHSVNGESRDGLVRLGTNGAVDASFSNDVPFEVVRKVARQPDGRYLVLTTIRETNDYFTDEHFLRLGANGQVDTNFVVTNDFLKSFTVAPDGSILLERWAVTSGDFPAQLIRVSSDGQRDLSFHPEIDFSLGATAFTPDGKIIAAGMSYTPCGGATSRVVRLNADGSRDAGFVYTPSLTNDLTSVIRVWMQPDGRALIYGFGGPGGYVPYKLIRLLPNGELDSTFRLDFRIVYANELLPLDDGRLLIAGHFIIDPYSSGQAVLRLLHDGTIDGTFWTDFDLGVGPDTIALGTDGQLFVGGSFYRVGGLPRAHVVRLFGGEMPPGPPLIRPLSGFRSFAWGENARLSAIAGASPTPSYHWYRDGNPIPGAIGPALALPSVTTNDSGQYSVVVSNSFGSVTGAVQVVVYASPYVVASSSQVESVVGQSITLSATVYGKPPLSLQWTFEGTPLPNATNTSLTLSNLTLADAGFYTLLAQNDDGTAGGSTYLAVLPALSMGLTNYFGYPAFRISGMPFRTAYVERSSDLRTWECNGGQFIGFEGSSIMSGLPSPTSNMFFRAFYLPGSGIGGGSFSPTRQLPPRPSRLR